MSRVDEIEAEIIELSPAERATFRAWFLEFDADAWDEELRVDSATGKLDALTEAAIRDHERGLSTKI